MPDNGGMKLIDEWDRIESNNNDRPGMTIIEAVCQQAMVDACPDMSKRYGRKRVSNGCAKIDAMVFLLRFIDSPDMRSRIKKSYIKHKLLGRLVLSNEYLETLGLAKTLHTNPKRQAAFDEMERELIRLLDLY